MPGLYHRRTPAPRAPSWARPAAPRPADALVAGPGLRYPPRVHASDRIWHIDRVSEQLIRATRTPEPFIDLDEVHESFLGLRQRLGELPLERSRSALLVDLRDGPLRSDPAFDDVAREHRPRVFAGFHCGAVLVRTLSGKIQLSRLERADQNYRAFDDEAEAIAFLRDTLDGVA